MQELAGEVKRLVLASRGRAFVLCTSTRRARQLYERLGFVVTRCGDTHHHMQYSADSHRR